MLGKPLYGLLLNIVADLESIRVGAGAEVRALTPLDGVVFVGSSCAGKSVIVDGMRQSTQLAEMGGVVPIRYISRPRRLRDSTTENRHVTMDEFEANVQSGEIAVHWVRKMERDRQERYGFTKVNDGEFPIYSGNNAFFNNPESIRPSGLHTRLLVVGVYAPDSVREERLCERSPNLLHQRPDEVLYRLGDSSANILPHVDVVVHNYGEYENIVVADVLELVSRIARLNAAMLSCPLVL